MNNNLFRLHSEYGKHAPRFVTFVSSEREQIWYCECGVFFYATTYGVEIACGVTRPHISDAFIGNIKEPKAIEHWKQWTKICEEAKHSYDGLVERLIKKHKIADIRERLEGVRITLVRRYKP